AAKSSSRPRAAAKPSKAEEPIVAPAKDGAAKEKTASPNDKAPSTSAHKPEVTKSAFVPITAKKAPARAPAPAAATPVAPEPPMPAKHVVESVSLIEPHTPKPRRAP